jgi:hypothetical protein
MKPLTPKEAFQKKLENVPAFVIEAINSLIVKNIDLSGTSVVKQNELLQEIVTKSSGNASSEEALRMGWLDLEPLYESYGWNVSYDKPGYCDSYEPSFTFTEKR